MPNTLLYIQFCISSFGKSQTVYICANHSLYLKSENGFQIMGYLKSENGFQISDIGKKNVYANHSPYLKSENGFQIRDVLITCSGHHILDVRDVTEVHQLIAGYDCIFWRIVVHPICMGRSKNTGDSGVTSLGYINVYLELDPPTKCHHLVELWEHFLQL